MTPIFGQLLEALNQISDPPYEPDWLYAQPSHQSSSSHVTPTRNDTPGTNVGGLTLSIANSDAASAVLESKLGTFSSQASPRCRAIAVCAVLCAGYVDCFVQASALVWGNFTSCVRVCVLRTLVAPLDVCLLDGSAMSCTYTTSKARHGGALARYRPTPITCHLENTTPCKSPPSVPHLSKTSPPTKSPPSLSNHLLLARYHTQRADHFSFTSCFSKPSQPLTSLPSPRPPSHNVNFRPSNPSFRASLRVTSSTVSTVIGITMPFQSASRSSCGALSNLSYSMYRICRVHVALLRMSRAFSFRPSSL